MIQKITLGIAVLALIVAGVAMNGFGSGMGGNSEFQKKSFTAGFFAGDNRQINVTASGQMNTASITFNGVLSGGGDVKQVSTSDLTATATEADLMAYNVFEIAAVAAAGQSAVTFKPPASTSLTTLIPNAGDTIRFWVFDSHSAAATTTTIGSNTGLDLEISTTTDGTTGNTGTAKVLKNGWSAAVTLIRERTGGNIKQIVDIYGDI